MNVNHVLLDAKLEKPLFLFHMLLKLQSATGLITPRPERYRLIKTMIQLYQIMLAVYHQ
jgi:hypothetical protein